MISPSGRTTSRPSTWFTVTPYLSVCGPPELFAILPPTVQACWLAAEGLFARRIEISGHARIIPSELPGRLDSYGQLEKRGASVTEGPLESLRELVDALHAEPCGAEGSGQRGEVRIGEIHLAV